MSRERLEQQALVGITNMTREPTCIDISSVPELARLAREVARDGCPRVLRDDTTDLAVLSPARPPRRRKGETVMQADSAAALSASWVGLVDGEQTRRELDGTRGDDRPPVAL